MQVCAYITYKTRGICNIKNMKYMQRCTYYNYIHTRYVGMKIIVQDRLKQVCMGEHIMQICIHYTASICDRICEKGSYTCIQFCDFKDV